MRDTINALGLYVENVSGGDLTIIRSVAMGVRATPSPATMTQVRNLRLTASDQNGELLAQWDREDGARVYRVQTCVDATSPPTNWFDKLTSTKTKCRLNDTLVSGQKVWVRVCAVGANDEGAWSDVACKTVP